MRLFQATHRFDHPWNQVTLANWRKYPNSMSPHILNVDVLERSVDPATGILRTERLLACEQPVPAIMQRLFNIGSTIYFYEVSEVDPQRREHRSVSRNITYSNVVMLDERVTYTADTADPGRTRFEQEAAVDVRGGMASVRSYVEDFCVNRFQANAEKGRKGLEEVIRKLLTDRDFVNLVQIPAQQLHASVSAAASATAAAAGESAAATVVASAAPR